MSIERLSILGIRSFGPDEAQIINFIGPLTVICGMNGCGKTTIIESLKYITTGALPPGGATSGQSFVHDPKMAGKSEVKAQIKLKFRDPLGKVYVCVRDFQAAQGRSKLSFSSLDAVLMSSPIDPATGVARKDSRTIKATEMDNLMPTLLGCPKAVLEHVVFCHQEDSNWPLQDGATLKLRFDQIFESTRYTKALEDIRKQRKERVAELRALESAYKESSLHVNEARKTRELLAKNAAQRDELLEAIAAMEEELRELDGHFTAASDFMRTLQAARKEAESLRVQSAASESMLHTMETSEIDALGAEEAREARRQLQLSREALDASTASMDDKVKDAQRKVDAAKAQLQSLRGQADQARAELQSLQEGAYARTAALKRLRDGQETWAGHALRDIVRFQQFRWSGNNFSAAKARDLILSITQSLKAQEQAWGTCNETHNTALEKAQSAYDAAKSALSNMQGQQERARAELASTQQAAQRASQRASGTANIARTLEAAQAKVQHAAAALEAAKKRALVNNGVTKVATLEAAIADLARTAKLKRDEATASSKQAATRLQLIDLAKEVREKVERAKSLLSSSHALKREHPDTAPEELVSAAEARLKTVRETLTSARRKHNDAARAAKDASVEEQRADHAYKSTILLLKADEEGLARAQQTLQLRSQECVLPQTRTKALIDLAAGPAAQLLSFSADPSQMAHEPPPPTHPAFIDVHTITASTRSLKSLEESRAKELLELQAVPEASVAFEREAEAESTCPCCTRAVDAEQLQRLKTNLASKRSKTKDDVDKAAKSLAALRALIAELSLAKPCIVEYHRHFEAARALYAAMTEANRAARDSNEILSAAEQALKQAEQRESAALEATAAAQRVQDCLAAAYEARQKFDSKRKELLLPGDESLAGSFVALPGTGAVPLDERGDGAGRAGGLLDDAPAAADAAAAALEDARDRLNVTRSELASDNKAVADATDVLRMAQSDLAAAKAAKDVNDEAQKDLTDHLERQRQLELERASLDRSIGEATLQVRDLHEALTAKQDIGSREVMAERKRLDSLRERELFYTNLMKQLETSAKEANVGIDGAQAPDISVNASAQSFAGGDAEGQADPAEALSRKITELTTAESRAIESQENGQVTLNRLAASRASLSLVRRVFDARQRLQAQKQSLAAVHADIAARTNVWLAAHGNGAGREPSELAKELQSKSDARKHEKSRCEGTLTAIQAEVRRLERECARPDLARADDNARRILVEKTVLDLACKDLERYHVALDTALQRYHKLKIDEINLTLRGLWASTYQGEDIDTIEIRSDLDESAAGGASTDPDKKHTRSYNYRVVMRKGESELDMRGRCSAGQKVLASIVIRLALADNFCHDTGILALDEPTTNIDSHNKAGLARALAGIIESRGSKSLQLIVITHDEEFVTEMGRALQGGGGSASKGQLGTYYRVSRNQVRAGVFHSRIDLQEFA